MSDLRRIDARHRLTIPRDAFRQSGLRPGERVVVRPWGPGRLVIEREDPDDFAEPYGDGYVAWISRGTP